MVRILSGGSTKTAFRYQQTPKYCLIARELVKWFSFIWKIMWYCDCLDGLKLELFLSPTPTSLFCLDALPVG
jgi:hypothetical protein